MRAVIAAAALLASAEARKYSGTAAGQWPFLGKFSYGVDKNGNPVGYFKFSWSYPGGTQTTAPAAGLYIFDDDQWAAVYPGTCSNAIANANQGSLTPLSTDPSMSPAGPIPITESKSPHFWYFTLAVPDSCQAGVQLSYTLELTQADGSQLSYDEIGLPTAYGLFWAMSVVLLAVHVWAHYFRAEKLKPSIVIWYGLSLFMVSLAWFCKMVDLATVASNGVGVPFFAGLADFGRLLSLMALWVMAALAANGVGISAKGITERNFNWVGYALLAFILFAYIALAVYYAVDIDPRLVVSFGSTWPAVVLLILTIMYAGWWAWRTRSTILAEVNTTKRRVLWHLALASAGNFFILPLVLFVGALTPYYMRARIVAGIDLGLVLALYCGLQFVLWPGHSADAFRSFGDASSLAGMLGFDDGGGNVDMFLAARLDEAYAYAPVAQADKYAL